MASMTSTAQKLQMALCMRGENIAFEQKRFFSTKCHKIVTKYIISCKKPGEKRERLLETYQLKEAVLLLAELYLKPREAGGDG